MKKLILLFFAFILLSAHDLFLKTDEYFVPPDSLVKLFLYNGTFDNSENIITRDRIIASSVIGPDYEFVPTIGSWYDLNEATYLQFKSGDAGTYLAGISTAPKSIELSAEDFNGYLEHDGILDELEARKNDGTLQDDAVEKYSKHVKCVFQVGDLRTDHHSKEMGYPLEFIFNSNPYDLGIDDEIDFTLLRNGKPLENQLVYYGHRKDGKHLTDEHIHDNTSVRTDTAGKGKVRINGSGHWYLRTIHMERVVDDTLDYESNWATITFEIK